MKSLKSSITFAGLAGLIGCWLTLSSTPAIAEILLQNVPLGVSTSAKPMTMITAGKDHKLFFEAYNDASDIDGDLSLDLRFKPDISYYGLFDSNVCYSYSSNLFSPAVAADEGKCSSKWSGNWLNYITTSRIDALRKVLYGGFREVDSTTQTILRRAYIPQDGHSWAKEYTSEAVDGYKISDYANLSQPTAGKRHFFGNLTPNQNTNCSTLSTCSNLAPWLSVVTNSSKRVWEWASKERPVLDSTHGGTRTDYSVRVEVCTATYHDGCKQYGSIYKPVGLLHDYGENDSMLFGLLTGSYNKNMSGGVLRKVVSSFSGEVNTTTGQFTSSNTIVKAFDNLRIRDYNNGRTDATYRNGSFRTGIMAQGDYVDWGNPIAEIMYEGLRYFAGKGVATTAYETSGSHDAAVGLISTTWDNPYDTESSSAKAPWCAKPNMLVMSDINPSYDSDQLPGSVFNTFTSDMTDLNVKTLADTITADETDSTGSHFIGRSGATDDGAPTAKDVNSLGAIRGLAPEEPTKQGSYYSASVAYYGKSHDINPSVINTQTLDSFYVVLASPLPKIEIPVSGKLITLVPFAKTIDGASVNRNKGYYQPTDPIVDFYVEEIANTDANNKDPDVNSGRPYANFRINYEADEQGNDFDMDVVAQYIVQVESSGVLTVKVKVTYESTGSNQNVGYVISGSNRDGVYLVAQDKNEELNYFLNVPPGQNPGYCDVTTPPATCKKLPYLGATAPANESVQTFSAGSVEAATLLKDPLWYAAKWGGFVDKNDNNKPDHNRLNPITNTLVEDNYEWDADDNGVPDTYFLVQNPLKLKETLKRTLDNIIERSASAGNVTSNSTAISTETQVFQSLFNSATWSGNLLAFPVNSGGVVATPNWQAANNVPSHEIRKIFTKIDGVTKEFKWSELTESEQSSLESLDVTEDILNYLRGDRTQELQSSGSFRNRTDNVLGDIVHSSPYFVSDTNTVYVGANDGMLHAFNATNGIELFAYIPTANLSRLKNLSKTSYGSSTNPHQYFVDGDIAVSTLAQTPEHNYLVATLGQGGKGLFGFDAATPASFSPTTHAIWEYLDSSDDNLGFMIGRPVIAKMNDGSTAVIVGNGYNSNDEKAVLYIFDLETGELIKSIDTSAGGDNGLATPGVFDSDADGDIDYIYAGDLKGNIWKFDVRGTESDHSTWGVALSGLPLFVAKDPSNVTQPITAQITVSVNDLTGDPNLGKTFIFFGTGSYFRSGDPGDDQVQSWYGLIDENSQILSRSETGFNLKQRTITATGTVSEKTVRTFSEGVADDMAGKKGWYIDLTTPEGSAEGERIVTSSKVYKLAETTLIASSIIPVVDPCVPGGKGYINAINPYTGARLTKGFFDLNNNNDFTDDQLEDAEHKKHHISSFDIDVGMPSEPVLIGNRLVVGGSSGEIKDVGVPSPPGGIRRSWRQLK